MANILVVDDLETNRKLLKTLLASQGHRIVEANDGNEALKRIREERPDLVITDMLMPSMDGVELVQRIRSDHEIAGLKVIFCSANYRDPETINLAQSCGVGHFLEQPVAQEQLLQVVDGFLAEGQGSPATEAQPGLEIESIAKIHTGILQRKLLEKIDELKVANQTLEVKVGERTMTLSTANEALTKEIEQRSKLELDLEYARNEQTRLKNEFFSHVSHELRGPITAVHQFSTLLNDQLAGPLTPDQIECTAAIVRNIDLLRAMIHDLLEVTRTQTGKLSVRLGCVAIPTVVADTISMISGTASAKGIKITTQLQDNLPPVQADAVRLQQILANLLGNAIKFTPKSGSIVLRAELSTDRASVQIHVADNGCGISSAHLQHIFDRLYQVSSENDESRKGLGLGLYICQQLVQLHGGRIWASSELSHGTEISFSIPVFSISRQLAPIMESTARADSVALFTVEISFNDKLPDRMDQDDTAVEVECILERCMMPDFDVLLPLRHMRVRHETFYLVARADHRGADVLRQRICNQLERSTLLTANGAGYTIAFEIMEFSASAIDGNRLQDLAQLTAAIEGRVTVAPRLTQ
jgi:two-component system, sensor histidine kinase and response regulator